MIHRPFRSAVLALTATLLLPAVALADAKSSAFTIGIGDFVPTSTSSSLEGFAPFPGTTIDQHGDISFEVSFGQGVIPGGYQITAMALQQKQTGTYLSPIGPFSADETITQIPVFIEGAGAGLGPVHFGGGLGYDFVSHGIQGGQSANGLIGDTFVDVGVGGGASLEAKYILGDRAALDGFYVGFKTSL
jgi:hypothetical protein